MIKKTMIKLSNFLALGIIILASVSCAKEIEVSGDGNDIFLPDGKVLINVYTNAENISQPSSRVADESSVSSTGYMPWVFVFSGNGDAAKFIEVKQAEMSGTPLMPRVLLTRRSGNVEVLVLANAPAYFYNSGQKTFDEPTLTTLLSGKTLAQAKSLLQTVDITVNAIPYDGKPIPMVRSFSLSSGITSTTSIGTSTEKLALKRIVAKVTVAESVSDFAINGWSIAGAKKNCMFFNETVGTSGNTINFNDALSPGETEPIYVYASNAGESFVIVKATYNGYTNQYYKLAFKDLATGTILPVERNKWYKFIITAVNEYGHSTFAGALAATAFNNITANLSVVDLDSYDIIDNGNYYLGVTNSQLLFYGLPQNSDLYKVVTVSTNATISMAGGVNTATLKNVNPIGSLALTSASSTIGLSSGTTPATTDIKIQTIGTGFISAEIEIRVGTLTKTIEINKADGILSFAAGSKLLNFQGNNVYTTAEISGTPSWLTLSSNGTNDLGISYTQTNATSLTQVYIKMQKNTTGIRSADIFLSRATEGRVKAYIKQDISM